MINRMKSRFRNLLSNKWQVANFLNQFITLKTLNINILNNKSTLLLFIISLFIIASCSPKITNQIPSVNTTDDSLITSNITSKQARFISDSITLLENKIAKNQEIQKKFLNELRDSIFDQNIHTVLLHKTGWIFSLPIISLNSDETLNLSFDDFDADIKRFKFAIQICDADWQILPMQTFLYIEGYNEDYITDYKLSFNTIQKYQHYNLVFPNQHMKIKKSGNYIIKIYTDDINQPILIKRFMVLENIINIKSKIKDATMLNDRPYRQEIDFSILTNNLIIDNPSRNLFVKIYQNLRPDNAINDLKPRLIKGNELDYNYDEENVFNGGNEFRNFDIKSLKYNSERINKITFENKANQVFLHQDLARPFKVYKTEDDINGKFAIKSDYTKDYEIEADYAWVHFSLPYEIPTIEGNIYVYGAFTNWKLTEESRLKYNYKTRSYETSLYVKQGYYNYQYVLKRAMQSSLDESFIEGNHAETENDYFIFVYYRQPGEQYDRLIGFQQINSINNRQ